MSLLPKQLNGIFLYSTYILNRNGEYDLWYNHRKYFLIGMGKLLVKLKTEAYSRDAIVMAKKKNLLKYVSFRNFKLRDFFRGLPYYYDFPYCYLYLLSVVLPVELFPRDVRSYIRIILT